jgi:hypothetical protein
MERKRPIDRNQEKERRENGKYDALPAVRPFDTGEEQGHEVENAESDNKEEIFDGVDADGRFGASVKPESEIEKSEKQVESGNKNFSDRFFHWLLLHAKKVNPVADGIILYTCSLTES